MPGCVEAPRLSGNNPLGLGYRTVIWRLRVPLAPRRLLLACLCNGKGAVYIAGNGQRGGVVPPAIAQEQSRLFAKKWGEIEQMFSHVMIGTNDLEKAKAFYDALLGTLGVRPAKVDGHRIFYFTKTGVFSVSKPINGEPATHANGGTIGFAAESPEQADAWHAAGLANGGKTCENPPGIREGSAGKMYLAYLRDLDGNKICAMHRMPT
jgi:catechol 2,3-dioxygenase-like lactoylglutathione lyase family enzyme